MLRLKIVVGVLVLAHHREGGHAGGIRREGAYQRQTEYHLRPLPDYTLSQVGP